MSRARKRFRSAIRRIIHTLVFMKLWPQHNAAPDCSEDKGYLPRKPNKTHWSIRLSTVRPTFTKFMDLPLEIREQIYTYVHCSEPDIVLIHADAPRLWSTTNVYRMPLIPSLNISRQIKEEAEDLYFRTFSFPVSLGPDLTQWDWVNQPVGERKRLINRVMTVTLLIRVVINVDGLRMTPTSEANDSQLHSSCFKVGRTILPNLKDVVIETLLFLEGVDSRNRALVEGDLIVKELADYFDRVTVGFEKVYLTSYEPHCLCSHTTEVHMALEDEVVRVYQCHSGKHLTDSMPLLKHVKEQLNQKEAVRAQSTAIDALGATPRRFMMGEICTQKRSKYGGIRHSGTWSGIG